MRHLGTALKAVGAVAVLGIIGNSVSLAATGQGFILGKSNKANKVTSLQRTTNGPVLNLRTKRATDAPFTLNGRGKVANLNADQIDGLDSTAFTRTADTAALTGRVGAAETAVAAADAKAVAADAKATAADAKAAGITPQLPIVQARVAATGVVTGRGLGAATIPSTGVFHIVVTEDPAFIYTNYVIQATPISDNCHVHVSSVSNKLYAATTDAAGAAVSGCQFYVTATRL